MAAAIRAAATHRATTTTRCTSRWDVYYKRVGRGLFPRGNAQSSAPLRLVCHHPPASRCMRVFPLWCFYFLYVCVSCACVCFLHFWPSGAVHYHQRSVHGARVRHCALRLATSKRMRITSNGG